MAELKWAPHPWSASAGIKAGGFVFIGGHRGFGDGFSNQFDDAFSRLAKTLAEFGLPLANLAQVNVRLRHIKDLPEMEKLFRNYFEKDRYPARMTSTTPSVDNDSLFSVSGVACGKEIEMAEVKRITTPHSYSLAVAAGDFVFLGLHRGRGDDFTAQFHDTLSYLKKTLSEFGLSLAELIKVNVWLKDIQDVRVYEQLFRDYFEEGKYPTRMGSTTEFIDDDCLLMIDGIAYRGDK